MLDFRVSTHISKKLDNFKKYIYLYNVKHILTNFTVHKRRTYVKYKHKYYSIVDMTQCTLVVHNVSGEHSVSIFRIE
jgi:hypothetical protein